MAEPGFFPESLQAIQSDLLSAAARLWVIRSAPMARPVVRARGPSEGEAKMWIVACATCGEQFAPKRSDAVYCSAACKQKAYERRQKTKAPRRL